MVNSNAAKIHQLWVFAMAAGLRISECRDAPIRSGVTLIELLVAIAIIGVLLAIILPAIQSSREKSRQVECKNHLKQVGLALQNHQSQFGSLPQDGQNGYGFEVFLLPMLDQSPLYQRLNPLTSPLPNPAQARPDMEDVILSTFLCPSHSALPRLEPSQFARSNYIGTANLFSTATRLTDVQDGESNTLAVGETISDQGWALPGTGACDSPPVGGSRFGSQHSGGANFVLCDGAVRFISSQINAATFQALATPAGRDVIGDW